MLTETLSEGLRAYHIGEKLRAMRLAKKMGLVELGGHTGLSPAMLSKIERGRLFPTLPTLLRIALVFSVGLDYFFADDTDRHRLAIVRKKDRQRLPETPHTSDVSYFFESLDFAAVERRLNAYLADFQSQDADKVRCHKHVGAEFLYVMTGKLGLLMDDREAELEEGDSVYFDSSRQHGYRRLGSKPCTALVVTVP